VLDKPVQRENIKTVLNNSFGMVGINSTVIVQKYPG
jgi:3-oxoacyl-[acyl-carrier-protein] synthase II